MDVHPTIFGSTENIIIIHAVNSFTLSFDESSVF